MRRLARRVAATAFVTLALSTLAVLPAQHAFAASEIKFIINKTPVTNFDIQRRAAFLKLQRRTGNLQKLASDEMVEQTLRAGEIQRMNIRVADQAVDEAFGRFASSNKMTVKQLDTILSQAGVTSQHFKDFIRAQMGWNQALGARFRSQGGSISEQEAIRKIREQGGAKPRATEYMLQQVIFVIPAAERGAIMGKRKREAEALRARFNGCATTREIAKGTLDVTVRDLGRVLEPELPPDWAAQVKAAKVGGATSVRETERGVEFLAICSTREVSDDKVAQLHFSQEASGQNKDKQAEEMSKKYTEELRARATIVQP